jgi:hypothetical protein
MSILVYHGAADTVKNPLASYGRPDLDFGQGFYVTTLRSQAERWAQIVNLRLLRGTPCLNIYEIDMERIRQAYRCLHFETYNRDWLDFIVHSRKGLRPWQEYDFVEGGVANDRVVDTVESYIAGTMPAEIALEQLAQHQPNNQMCLLSQHLIDECLHFKECLPLSISQKGGKL